jgi:hypothetical protein
MLTGPKGKAVQIGSVPMLDLIYLAIPLALFALMVGYAAFCDEL